MINQIKSRKNRFKYLEKLVTTEQIQIPIMYQEETINRNRQ